MFTNKPNVLSISSGTGWWKRRSVESKCAEYGVKNSCLEMVSLLADYVFGIITNGIITSIRHLWTCIFRLLKLPITNFSPAFGVALSMLTITLSNSASDMLKYFPRIPYSCLLLYSVRSLTWKMFAISVHANP